MTILMRSISTPGRSLRRSGISLLIDGGKRGDNGRMVAGLVIVVADFALKRKRRPPSRIYRTDVRAGQSIAIRVVDNGEVVSETVVQDA